MSRGRRLCRRPPSRQITVAFAPGAVVVLPWIKRNDRATDGRFTSIDARNVTCPLWPVTDAKSCSRESSSKPPRGTPTLDDDVSGAPDSRPDFNDALGEILRSMGDDRFATGSMDPPEHGLPIPKPPIALDFVLEARHAPPSVERPWLSDVLIRSNRTVRSKGGAHLTEDLTE